MALILDTPVTIPAKTIDKIIISNIAQRANGVVIKYQGFTTAGVYVAHDRIVLTGAEADTFVNSVTSRQTLIENAYAEVEKVRPGTIEPVVL